MVAGRRASLKASEGSWSGERWRTAGHPRTGAVWGRLSRAVMPGGTAPRARSSTRPGAPRTWRSPAAPPASPTGEAAAAPRLAARPGPRQPARPAVASGHAGRSRSAAGQAAQTRRAPAPAPQATRPASRRCAPRLPQLQSLAIFTPQLPRQRLIQCLVINLAFQNGQRAG